MARGVCAAICWIFEWLSSFYRDEKRWRCNLKLQTECLRANTCCVIRMWWTFPVKLESFCHILSSRYRFAFKLRVTFLKSRLGWNVQYGGIIGLKRDVQWWNYTSPWFPWAEKQNIHITESSILSQVLYREGTTTLHLFRRKILTAPCKATPHHVGVLNVDK